MPDIEIKTFKGLFTNADPEDIPIESSLVLKNLRPYNGRLIKTFGMGNRLNAVIPNTVKGLFTHVNENYTAAVFDGKKYFTVYINPSTKVVTIYYYLWILPATFLWYTYTLSSTYYFRDDYNPIIQYGGALRFLPGRVSKADGTNESKGIWIDYIDRDFFDGNYATPTDYTAAFFDYDTEIVAPALSVTLSSLANGLFTAVPYYYKFSYIYDGIQESLLSSPVSITPTVDNLIKMAFSITKTAHNKRVTALKVYRCTTVSGAYQYIYTIDFLRPNGQTLEDTTEAYNGEYYAYLDDWNKVAHPMVVGNLYEIVVSGISKTLEPVTPNPFDKVVNYPIGGLGATYWNAGWTINDITSGIPIPLTSGNKCCTGQKVVITNTGNTYAEDSQNNKYFYYAPSIYQKVLHNVNIAFQLDGTALGTLASQANYAVMNVLYGLYGVFNNGTAVDYVFFDNNIAVGAYHPLAGEVSIKVNAQQAKVIGGVLWLGNIILDPGGTGEIHQSWGAFSETQQIDVVPVSNIIDQFDDEQGGKCTGIQENMGNPVYLHRFSIKTINYKANPTSYGLWAIIHAVHTLGNIAPRGSIQVLQDIYVVWFDGIYRLRPNNLAASDDTPTERLRVSEPINDWFLGLSLTAKEGIISTYNPITNEIIFCDSVNGTVYAFDVNEQTWREIDSTVSAFHGACYDEKSEPMLYNSTTGLVYSPNIAESVTCEFTSKQFVISDERPETVREMDISYLSAQALTVKIYGEDGSTVVKTMTLPANSFLQSYKLFPKYALQRFKFDILGIAGTSDMKISRILIETD